MRGVDATALEHSSVHTRLETLARLLGRQSWLPVRVRHWPYNTLDGFRQRTIRRCPEIPDGEFHLVAFTCRKHFYLLECALRTLLIVSPPRIRRILLYVDHKDLFQPAEVDRLRQLSSAISIHASPTFTGWGFDSARIQFRVFSDIAATSNSNDYIVKMDSDLLFMSRWIFASALKSGFDIVGDGRYVDFDYPQGGLFFIRQSIAARLLRYCEAGAMESLLPGRRRPAEEEVLREVARAEQASTWLTRFMMFPDEFQRGLSAGPRFIAKARSKFCVLHFVRSKETMPEVFRSIVLPTLETRLGGENGHSDRNDRKSRQ